MQDQMTHAEAVIVIAELAEENERLRKYIDALHGNGDVRHDYNGLCPDETQPDSRDDECPACLLLTPNALIQPPPKAVGWNDGLGGMIREELDMDDLTMKHKPNTDCGCGDCAQVERNWPGDGMEFGDGGIGGDLIVVRRERALFRALLKEARPYVLMSSPSGRPWDFPKDLIDRIDMALTPND